MCSVRLLIFACCGSWRQQQPAAAHVPLGDTASGVQGCMEGWAGDNCDECAAGWVGEDCDVPSEAATSATNGREDQDVAQHIIQILEVIYLPPLTTPLAPVIHCVWLFCSVGSVHCLHNCFTTTVAGDHNKGAQSVQACKAAHHLVPIQRPRAATAARSERKISLDSRARWVKCRRWR